MGADAILINPVAVWGIICGLASSGGYAIWQGGKIILKTARAKRMIAAGLDFKPEERENIEEETALTSAILQFLKHQEAREAADRQERNRQWERIEDVLDINREQIASISRVLVAIEHFAQSMDIVHRHQSDQIGEIKSNVIKLSDWLRDNNRAYPPYQQPPRTAQS